MKHSKLLPLLLALVLLFSLCACKAQADPNEGSYPCARALYTDGTDRPDGASLTLSGGHRAVLSLGGTEEEMEWALDGESLILGRTTGEAFRGKLSGGVIEIALQDADCIFVREGVDYTPPPLPEPEPEPEPEGPSEEELAELAAREKKASWWSGSFYGWWFIREADGAYSALAGSWWDLCADGEADTDGYVLLTLWDEDNSRANPYGKIEFSLDFSEGYYGTAVSVRGFFGPDVIEPGALAVDPDGYAYENLIVLSGTYSDETGSYAYEAYLRPWGQLWDDAAAVSETLLPYYYASWYLPRIEAQEPMPDRIGEGAAKRGED